MLLSFIIHFSYMLFKFIWHLFPPCAPVKCWQQQTTKTTQTTFEEQVSDSNNE